jgi:hypothetical protein
MSCFRVEQPVFQALFSSMPELRDDRVGPMKSLITFAMILALGALVLGAAVQAKPAPLDLRVVALSAEDTAIDSGPSGASLESDYFRAPQMPYSLGRLFPCRLQLRVFDKARLAQSCN